MCYNNISNKTHRVKSHLITLSQEFACILPKTNKKTQLFHSRITDCDNNPDARNNAGTVLRDDLNLLNTFKVSS